MGRRTSLVRRPSRRSRFEGAIKALLFAAASVSVAHDARDRLLAAAETISFFGDVPIGDYLFGTKWTPLFAGDQQSFGVLPLVWGTLYLTGIGLLVAVPVGLLSGMYLSEFAPRRVRKVVKPVLEVLAGVPTIVFGYFALTFFTPEVLRDVLGLDVNQFNALSAGIILGVLVVPTIATLVEDAMSAVPQSLREGSAGLGANRVQTAIRVVFPAALSGVVAALVLGASRAIGETVIILIAGGQPANLSLNPTESYQSMAAFIAATSRGDIPTGSIEYETIFVVGMTLFVFTLILNIVSIRLVRQLPAGVRMTGAQIAARAARPGRASRGPRAATARSPRSSARSCSAPSASACSRSPRCSTTSRATGCPKLSVDFLTSFPSRIIPASSGIQSAIYGTLWLMVMLRGDRRPARRRDRGLPRGVRGPQEVVEPHRRGQHPEPRRGALGRLRHPRARVHRARPDLARAHGAGGRDHARAAGAARRDHRRARGDPRRAAVDPRGLARARRHAVADDLEAGAARARSPASRPA